MAQWRLSRLPIAAKPASFWKLLSGAAGFRYNSLLRLEFDVTNRKCRLSNSEESDASWQALYNLENK